MIRQQTSLSCLNLDGILNLHYNTIIERLLYSVQKPMIILIVNTKNQLPEVLLLPLHYKCTVKEDPPLILLT